jgi:hypothetical protein
MVGGRIGLKNEEDMYSGLKLLAVFTSVLALTTVSVAQRGERGGSPGERGGRDNGSVQQRSVPTPAPNVQRQEQRREVAPPNQERRNVTPQQRETRPKQDVVRERRQETTPKRETGNAPEVRQKRQESIQGQKEKRNVDAPASKSLKEISADQGRVVIKGNNYTVWRGQHRVRVANRWRTFGPLTVLGIVTVAGVSYYPYAYLSAPEPVCDGLTEDGFVLRWVQVKTVEGDLVYQCVAFDSRR